MFRRFLIFLMLACAPVAAWSEDQADFTLVTDGGNRLSITSTLSPLEINRMHSWRLRLTDAEYIPIANARITVAGGMPGHDHGLPTRPEVTLGSESGSYLLEGLRFHMPGRWLLQFTMVLGDATDSASLEFDL